MNLIEQILLLAGGGAAGSALRGALGERFVGILPWVTLGINVTGSFAAGWLNAWADSHPLSAWLRPLAITGICGGYTTFSSMAFQALGMWRKRHTGWLMVYLSLTLALGLGAAWLGLLAGKN